MILDKELEFSNQQAVTSTGANASTNLIDMGHSKNYAAGEPLYLIINVDEAVTSAGAATVDFQLQSDDNSPFASPTVIASSGAVAKADLVAGHQIAIPLPPLPKSDKERYLRVNYEVVVAALTAGKFSSYISSSPQTN